MTLKDNFGKRLREIRDSYSLTQEQLAELANLQSETISRIETGSRFVRAEILESLSKALKTDYAEFFKFDKQDTLKPSSKMKTLDLELSTLKEDELDYILSCILAYKKLKK